MGNLFSDEDRIHLPRKNSATVHPPPEKVPLSEKVPLPKTSPHDIPGFAFPYNQHCTFMLDPTCCICLDTYNEQDIVQMLPCNHICHRRCLMAWFCKQPRCPLCLQ